MAGMPGPEIVIPFWSVYGLAIPVRSGGPLTVVTLGIVTVMLAGVNVWSPAATAPDSVVLIVAAGPTPYPSRSPSRQLSCVPPMPLTPGKLWNWQNPGVVSNAKAKRRRIGSPFITALARQDRLMFSGKIISFALTKR